MATVVRKKGAKKGAKFTKKTVRTLVTRTLDPWRANQEYHFTRMIQDGNLITATDNTPALLDATSASTDWGLLGTPAGDVGGYGVMQFSLTTIFNLQQVAGASEFINLFNEYRIDKVEMKIEAGMGDSYAGNGSQLPTIYSVHDSNDSTALASLSATNQWANVQEHVLRQGHPFKRTLVVKPALATYVNVSSTGYAQPSSNKSVWMDISNPAIPHYGFKFWLRGIPTLAGAGFCMRFQAKMYLSFRKPK